MEGFLSIYMIGCGGDSDDGEGEVQDAAFVSAAPGSSDLAANASITVTFDNDPGAVTASAGDVSGAEKSRTISSPFTLGTLALVLSWENGGSHTLNYNITAPDTAPSTVTDGSVKDGDKVHPEAINSDAKIEITFREDVTGYIALQTEGGDDVGWLGKVKGNKATLYLVKRQKLDYNVPYIIVGEVTDAAGNATEVNTVFSTAVKTVVPIEITDATFDNIVLNSEFPIVVEFCGVWCPFCRQMGPIVREVASEHRKTFAIAKLDIDSNQQITRKYQVRGVPAYIVFQDGEIVGRIGGALPKVSFVREVLRLISN